MLSPATLKLLQEELSNPVLDDYTVAVLARRDLERGDEAGAMSRLRVDCDKFRMVTPVLCQLVMNWHEARAAASSQWTQPPAELSPGERFWVK